MKSTLLIAGLRIGWFGGVAGFTTGEPGSSGVNLESKMRRGIVHPSSQGTLARRQSHHLRKEFTRHTPSADLNEYSCAPAKATDFL